MKTLALLFLFAQVNPPSYVYPVRVQIISTTKNFLGHGSGRANFYDESLGVQGFDFRYQGCRQIIATPGASRDQARWIARDRLAIVNPENKRECVVEVTFVDYLYEVGKDGKITTESLHPNGHQ